MLAGNTNSRFPFLNQLENLCLNRTREYWWPFWEPLDELIEEFLGRNLEVEGVSAILDEIVKKLSRGCMSEDS